MPCLPDCKNRVLLLSKEDRLTKLNQTKTWLNELCRQEPERREEVTKKMSIVDGMVVKTVTESGILVNKISQGCHDCTEQTQH